jgi:hypothetical protein
MRDLLQSEPYTAGAAPIAASADPLPEPVARYFAFALPQSPRRIIAAEAEWMGTFLPRRGGRPMPFTARQRFLIDPPGFVWKADMKMFPGLHVRVRDSYDRGRGSTRARLAGIISIANQPGTRHTGEAALQRFLAEAIWFPTALLPSSRIGWLGVNNRRATATLSDGEHRASVDFHFGDRGEIVGCSALRYRDVGGRSILTPWQTRSWDYESVDGFMIPRSAEAEWILPEGSLTYWRGTLEGMTYTLGADISSHAGER